MRGETAVSAAVSTALGVVVLGVVLLGAFAALTDKPRSPTAVNGIGVLACGGLVAIIVTRSDGSIAIYDAQNEPNEAQRAEALSVPLEERKAVVVPCATGVRIGIDAAAVAEQ